MDYYSKYIKYKNKYILEKKRLLRGGSNITKLQMLEKKFIHGKNNIENLFNGNLDNLREEIKKAAEAERRQKAEEEERIRQAAEKKAKELKATEEAERRQKAEAKAEEDKKLKATEEAERNRREKEAARKKAEEAAARKKEVIEGIKNNKSIPIKCPSKFRKRTSQQIKCKRCLENNAFDPNCQHCHKLIENCIKDFSKNNENKVNINVFRKIIKKKNQQAERKKAEDKRRKAEEEERKKQEEERKKQEEEERKRLEEEERKRLEEEERKRLEEEEKKKKEEEAARKKAAEEEKKKKEEAVIVGIPQNSVGGTYNINKFNQLLKDATKFTSKKNKIKIIKFLKAVVKKLKQKLNINMMMFSFFGFMGGNKDLNNMTNDELNNMGMKLIDEIKDIAIKYKNIIDKFPWFKKVLNKL